MRAPTVVTGVVGGEGVDSASTTYNPHMTAAALKLYMIMSAIYSLSQGRYDRYRNIYSLA